MAKRLDQILVVDLECTCWEKAPPPGQVGEIIEIGICLLDPNTLTRWNRESIFVRPERSQVSPFCTSLTTLTQEQVSKEYRLPRPVRSCAKNTTPETVPGPVTVILTGASLSANVRKTGVHYPFGKTHLNVKNILSIALKAPFELAMDKAMRQLNLPLEGTHHRGVDDAWNIAHLLALLLGNMRVNSDGQENECYC